MHLIFDTFRITMQRPSFLHRSVLNKRPPLCKVKKEEESVCAAAIAATVAHVTKTWITITQNNSLYIAAWIMYKNKERKKFSGEILYFLQGILTTCCQITFLGIFYLAYNQFIFFLFPENKKNHNKKDWHIFWSFCLNLVDLNVT